MRALVTRAEPGASRTAKALTALGIEPVVAPFLTIRDAESITADLKKVQALVFTSPNGVRAWAALRTERKPAAWCVGDATEAAAKEAGFDKTRSAGGDSEALIEMIVAGLEPEKGALLHVRGAHTAGDVSGTLMRRGFHVQETVAYRAEAAPVLPAAAKLALEEKRLSAVLFHSPRAAAAFTALVDDAELNARLKGLIAAAISLATADNLIASDWGAVRIADTPDEAALLERVGSSRRAP